LIEVHRHILKFIKMGEGDSPPLTFTLSNQHSNTCHHKEGHRTRIRIHPEGHLQFPQTHTRLDNNCNNSHMEAQMAIGLLFLLI